MKIYFTHMLHTRNTYAAETWLHIKFEQIFISLWVVQTE